MTSMTVTVSQQDTYFIFQAENPLDLAGIEESLRESGINHLVHSGKIIAFLNQGDDPNAMNKELLLHEMAAWYQSDEQEEEEDAPKGEPSIVIDYQESV